MYNLLFRWWLLDIQIWLYNECLPCTSILDIGLSHRFVQQISMMLFRYCVLDIPIGLYREYQCCFFGIGYLTFNRVVQWMSTLSWIFDIGQPHYVCTAKINVAFLVLDTDIQQWMSTLHAIIITFKPCKLNVNRWTFCVFCVVVQKVLKPFR